MEQKPEGRPPRLDSGIRAWDDRRERKTWGWTKKRAVLETKEICRKSQATGYNTKVKNLKLEANNLIPEF
jgi:hypothetical protein